MERSESIVEIAKALAQAQGELRDAIKDRDGYGYQYADLAQILQIARPVLSKNGLAVVQSPTVRYDERGTRVVVETVLMHVSGEYLVSELEMPVERGKGMSAAQAIGAVITYARRYALAAILGIAQEDTDAAVQHEQHNGADPVSEWTERFAQARTVEELQSLGRQAASRGYPQEVVERIRAAYLSRMQVLQRQVQQKEERNEG